MNNTCKICQPRDFRKKKSASLQKDLNLFPPKHQTNKHLENKLCKILIILQEECASVTYSQTTERNNTRFTLNQTGNHISHNFTR